MNKLLKKYITFLLFYISNAYAQNVFHPSEMKTLNAWSPRNFTDPVSFKGSKNFRFLYHEISGGIRSLDEKKWSYRLINTPELIEENPRVSYSVITQKHRSVYIGLLGLILEVPTDNIVTTSKEDIGSGFSGRSRNLQTMANERKLLSPRRLINLSKNVGYNEVVAVGTSTSNSKIRTLAIVIPCGHDINLTTNENGTERSEESFDNEFEKCIETNNKNFRINNFDQTLKETLKDARAQGRTILGLNLTQ